MTAREIAMLILEVVGYPITATNAAFAGQELGAHGLTLLFFAHVGIAVIVLASTLNIRAERKRLQPKKQ